MTPTTSRCARLVLTGLIVGPLFAIAACASHPKPPGPAPVASTPFAPPQTSPAPTGPVGSAPLTSGLSSAPRPGSAEDFVSTAGERVFFDYDQYSLRADATPVLTAQAAWLQRYAAVQVRLEGNADERGTREYNLALGARRADSVKTFLLEHGVAAARITTISYGKERPFDTSETEAGMARNRNVHTAITAGAR